MSKLKITQAFLAKFTKSFGFQRIQKELVQCANTLLAGSTMGARQRRAEFLEMLKQVHKAVKEHQASHGDAEAFEAVAEQNKVSLANLKKLAAETEDVKLVKTNTTKV